MKYDHAVVTLYPGKMPNRRVMILSGSNTWATLAAAEYVTAPEHSGALNQHFINCFHRTQAEEHPPYFQILLSVEIKDDQLFSVSYPTHHDLDILGGGDKVFTAQTAGVFDKR